MFSIDQIKSAHARVKSGADFPSYVQDLKNLGVTDYTHQVADGSITYYGAGNYTVTSAVSYPAIDISHIASAEKLKHALSIHQQGQTNYLTFCEQAAASGVRKWLCDFTKMTCTYLDGNDTALLVEQIPA